MSIEDELTRSDAAGIVTRTQLLPNPIYWRYREVASPAFDPDVFDEHKLAARGLQDGVARAGRGNTIFFHLLDHELVLRHYWRGGMVRSVSKDRYLYTGLQSTRAMQEFSVLLELQKRDLYAPLPYACRVIKHGLFYQASLVTYRLAGRTLAECLEKDAVSLKRWESIGSTIAQFHREGLFHADLNAHNIMIDNHERIALIDFDRARFRKDGHSNLSGGWRRQNVERLFRSLKKIALQARKISTDRPFDARGNRDAGLTIGYEDGYKAMLASWESRLKQ